jgi:hypothetical protein
MRSLFCAPQRYAACGQESIMKGTGTIARSHAARLAAVVLACVLPLAGLAQVGAVTQDQIERALTRQGFQVQQVTRTLLGRVHIIATRNGLWREVVLNPSTGEILRDISMQDGTGQGGAQPPAPALPGLELN